MTDSRFRIIFDKLDEATRKDSQTDEKLLEVKILQKEIDEIEELQRLAATLEESESYSYTIT